MMGVKNLLTFVTFIHLLKRFDIGECPMEMYNKMLFLCPALFLHISF